MSFGNNPITGTQTTLPANQFPISSVAVPNTANGDLTALEGGPISTDSNNNKTAPASMYVKDGGDVNSGSTTDTAITTDSAGTISAKLRGLVKISGDIWDSTNHRIRVDGSGVTQPISAASLPLPTGAATSAKQPALGTAGSASTDVITVQGIASMTPLKVDGSGVTQPISGSVSVSNFPGTQAISGTVTANAGTGTFTNQQSNVQTDFDTSAGTQNVTLFGVALPASGGAVVGGTSSNPLRIDPTGTTTQPVSGTVNAAQSGTWNITNISGTVSLPTGAATAAKQPALGTAGSASSDVLSVQGIASMTPIKTDGSGVTQPVSGTVTANAGTGTFTNQQSNVTTDYDTGAGTQNITLFGVALPASGGAVAGGTSSNPLRIDPTGTTTQPVSGTVNAAQSGTWNITNISGTVSLPTGAATSAKQPALGTAGSASSDVLTVQGIASMTALKVDGSAVTQPISGTVTANVGTTNGLALDTSINGILVSQGSTTSGEKGPLIQGAVTTSAPTYTTAQTSPISLTTAGAVRVDGSGVTQPISGTVSITANSSVNVAQIAGTTTDTNSGNKSAGTLRVVLATDQPQLTNALKVDGSAVTQPISGTITANAGTGTFTNQQSNITSDYDTSAGTQNVTMFGVALPASGGAVAGGTSSNPLRTDPTGTTTQPISASSLPLPTGAATSAKQPALGTAGSASSDVLTVQGIASMTALKVDGSAVTQPVSGTITANQGGSNWSTNTVQLNGTTIDTNSGNKSAGTQRVVLATDQPQLTNALKVDGSAVTQPISGTITANAGTGTMNVSQQASGSTSTTLQNAQTGNVNGTSLNVLGMATVVFTVTESGFTGTVNFEGTEDNSNWSPLLCVPAGGTTTVTTATTAGQWTASCAGLQSVRARTSGVSAGNVTVTGHAVPVSAANLATGGGGGGGGTSSSFGSAFPSTGTAIGASDGTNMQGLLVESSSNKNLRVALYNGSTEAAVTGSNALKVDGSGVTQPVSGTVSITANSAVNVAQVGGTNTDTNSGNKSAGTLRVVIATDQPQLTNALKVDGSAVTQPVSGTITANAGSGTFNNQQSNITVDYDTGAGTQTMTMFGVALPASGGAVAGGTSSNPLRIDPTGTTTQPVSGTITANAGTNLNTSALALESGGNLATLAGGVSSSKYQTNVAQVGGSTVSTAATGVQKVGIVGNGGATVDSTVGAGTAPTNAVVIGSIYNSSAPAPTSGQAMALQADQAGNIRTFPGVALATLSAWNSSTSLNATQTIFTNSGAEAVLVQLTQTSTLTAGAVTFEVSYDGSNWSTIPANCVLDPTSTTFAQISIPYTVQASTNKAFLLNMNGAQGLRIKLSTQITGTGTVTPNYALLPLTPADTVIAYSPTAANFNVTAVQSGTWTEVPNAATSGGSTPSHTISASGTNATSLKGSAGQVYGFSISNSNASARYFKLYDKSTAPTVGTDTPKMTVQVPGSGTVIRAFPVGLVFSNGIGWGLTTGIADNDTGSVGTDISVDIDYK